jgi:hypothetical protein
MSAELSRPLDIAHEHLQVDGAQLDVSWKQPERIASSNLKVAVVR